MERCIHCKEEVDGWLLSSPVKCPHCRKVQVPQTNTNPLHTYKQKMREEFRKIGEGSVRFMATRMECYDFLDTYADGLIAAIREIVIPEEQVNTKEESDVDYFFGYGFNVCRKEILTRFGALTTTNE